MEECEERIIFNKKDNYTTFVWSHPRKSQIYCLGKKTRLIWDLGTENLFEVKKIYLNNDYDDYGGRLCAGWGNFINKNIFIENNL